MLLKKKILIVFGTRPEAIKMAPVVKALKGRTSLFDVKVCVTAQHREMLDQVLDLFDIRPDFDLNLMKPNQDLYSISSDVLQGVKAVLCEFQPALVLVHGDTTTSSFAALAAFYEKIPVGHVEAGLRTKNIYSPWPEEMNRRLTGALSTYHYSPTIQSKANLLAENVAEDHIVLTGNTVIDSLHMAIAMLDDNPELLAQTIETLEQQGYSNIVLDSHGKPLVMDQRPLVLVTGHRRENMGETFRDICFGIKKIAEEMKHVDIVYPVHLNPNVSKPVHEILGATNNIFLIPPVEYLSFTLLMKLSTLILTDSGGIQEEAPSLGKPVLVMRDTTERPEALAAGTARLVGVKGSDIHCAVIELLTNSESYQIMSTFKNPYGDGSAAEIIASHIEKVL